MLFKLKVTSPAKRAIRRAIVPNAITAVGLICGLFVIFKMNMTEPGESDYKVVLGSAIIFLAAVAADFADGAVARLLRAESSFGGLFDALSDAITFGVAPVVMVLKTLSPEQGSLTSYFVTLAAMLYALCGVLRLVRFSIITESPEPASDLIKRLPNLLRESFTGLPITIAASALASLNLFLASSSAQKLTPKFCASKERPLGAAMFLLAYLMISRWRFFSLKSFQIRRVPSFGAIFAGTAIAASLLFCLNYSAPLACVALTWGYIAIAWALSGYNRLMGKRSHAFDDLSEAETHRDLESHH